jgi:hemin uptake protein HemP
MAAEDPTTAMTAEDQAPEALPVESCGDRSGDMRIWRSEDILGDSKEVLIVHGGETYRLRRTRLGKLILQK